MQQGSFNRECRELFRLALPLAAAQAGTQLMGLVDVAVLGRLGARELAASGLGNAIFFAMSVVGIGIVLGIDPLVAQAVGAHDRVRARRVMWQGVWLAIIIALALSVALLVGALAVPLVGAHELTALARTFLLIRTLGVIPFLLFFVVRSYLQAHGLTWPILASMILANVANFLLDILLVFGGSDLPSWAGPLRAIPPMGVAGAAISTVISTFLELAVVAAAVPFVDVPEHVDHRVRRRDVRRAFRIGLPVGLQMGAEVGIFALVALLAGNVGTLDLAAHQLVIGLASFTFTVALGVAAAGTVRVGLAIGARDALRTRLAGQATFLAGMGVMGVSALIFAAFPRLVARIVTNQQDVIEAAVPLFFVAAVFQLSDGAQAAGAGVLRGAGDTKYTFYANVVGHWLIGFPVAILLGFGLHLGVVGLWWGLCAGLTVVAILLFRRFDRLSKDEIAPVEH